MSTAMYHDLSELTCADRLCAPHIAHHDIQCSCDMKRRCLDLRIEESFIMAHRPAESRDAYDELQRSLRWRHSDGNVLFSQCCLPLESCAGFTPRSEHERHCPALGETDYAVDGAVLLNVVVKEEHGSWKFLVFAKDVEVAPPCVPVCGFGLDLGAFGVVCW